ncbi:MULTISPECIES: hypothetical protein [Thiorhodovibrio]|uniref:hypothetical protein n=1 Tax=Thiorhodovibrio TaxID=61593 RepID=UPI0019127E5D|nr:MULTISPECIES: hypothetical protein [Thiorhodovibrio]MBK5968943.1 hypothetical protein [Thiorhodovibrio winogradskyi]WPL10342.1 hypothetical protein Thiosp_00054 [Thiorhodovibrio litoralis]
MTTLEIASLIMSAEFALVAVVMLFIMRRRQHKVAQSQDSQSAELHSSVQGALPSRRESLTKLFQANAQLKGRKLTTTVNLFLAREQAFYDAMLNIYLNKDGKSLADVPDELRKVLIPWTELQESANEDISALGDLRAENAELSEQLQHNKEIIERLLEEYDATFNRFQHNDEDGTAGEDATQEPEEEESLENQILDIVSSEPPEAEENLDAIDPLPDDADDADEGEDGGEEQVTFLDAQEEIEELADLFDSEQDPQKP